MFGGWDVFPDSAYEAARKAGVLEEKDLAPIKDFMDGIKPWKAVFDPQYVKKLKGTHVKKGKSLRDLADLARRIYPLIKRMLFVERERAPGRSM